jgi:hypothetical protein
MNAGVVDMIRRRTPLVCLDSGRDLVRFRHWSELYVSADGARS